MMTNVVCPSCGASATTSDAVREGALEWSCRSCNKTFEVRVVFFERRRVVDKDRFRTQVLRAMERQGLTQAELGRLVGVSGAYISTILSGKREVSAELADRVLHALRPGSRA